MERSLSGNTTMEMLTLKWESYSCVNGISSVATFSLEQEETLPCQMWTWPKCAVLCCMCGFNWLHILNHKTGIVQVMAGRCMSVTYSATQMHSTLCYGKKKRGKWLSTTIAFNGFYGKLDWYKTWTMGAPYCCQERTCWMLVTWLTMSGIELASWKGTTSLDGTLREEWSEVSVAHPIPPLRLTIPDVLWY